MNFAISEAEKWSQAGKVAVSVGAGGTFGSAARSFSEKADMQYLEIDVDPDRAPDLVADVCTFELEKPARVVFALEVLEHVNSPNLAVEQIYQNLEENGVFIGSTPFVFPIHDKPFDFFRFTEYGLIHLLRRFDDVSITPRSGVFGTLAFLFARQVFSDNRWLAFASILFCPIFFVLHPISVALDRVFPTRFMPTGYLFYGVKRAKRSTYEGSN